MREIIDGTLWIGNARDARNLAGLAAAEITAVVDLADNERPAALAPSTTYLRFPLSDDGNNSPALLACCIAILAELLRCDGQRVLVACSAGMSRSPAMTAAALHRLGRGSLDECLAIAVRGAPRDISPSLWNAIVEIA